VGDIGALKTAARAAIVMPAVFAIADKLIGKPQTALFASFGSLALLVFVEFGGPPLRRLLAYVGLACVGTLYISLGTLCSRTPWIAALGMAAVGFVTLFSGIFSGYFAAGTTGALLTFVLPATIRAPNSALPDRLEGWGLACGAGICAVMFLWPPRRHNDLRRQSAAAYRAVAELLLSGDEQTAERAEAAQDAVKSLGRQLLGPQHRPTGPAAPTAAIASIPDELDWIVAFATSGANAGAAPVAGAADAEATAASAALLRAAAERLDGGESELDFARLDRARDAVAEALVRRLIASPLERPDALLPETLAPSFRLRVVTYSARQLALYALLASGSDAAVDGPPRSQANGAGELLRATEHFAVEHVNTNSVWLQNSVRGAAGLAVAVYIAQRTGLQHGFWVVLGTLSVLRSNALSTGWSILSALGGTAVGIVAGALLVIGIGSHELVLWAVLPIALLFAAYAPRAISFAAGQAAFTVVLFVLFNIIHPVGWRVGVVRAEDIAIGFAISLGVGLLFWPRGAGAVLARTLAAAYTAAIDLFVASARPVIGEDGPTAFAGIELAADDALHRLDDAFGQYLGERAATRYDLEAVAGLVAGASRVRRAAGSLGALALMVSPAHGLERCAANLARELQALQAWYIALGFALTNRRPIPAPHIRDEQGLRRLLECVRTAAGSADPKTVRAALVLLWTRQYLDSLWQLEQHIGELSFTAKPALARQSFARRLRAFAS
jgi:hypothetical protein